MKSQNDVIMSWLWGWQQPQTTSLRLSHIKHTKCLSTLISVYWHTVAALHSYTPNQLGSDFEVTRGNLWRQNDVITTSWLRLTATSNCFPQPYAEILGDPYSKKSPLPSIETSPRLAISPKDTSYRILGQSRIHHDTSHATTTLEY